MRVIALDIGLARIGVAVSDPNRAIALPLKTLEASSPELFKTLLALIEEYDVDTVVYGLPLTLSGKNAAASRRSNNFIEKFSHFLRENNSEVAFVPVDERLTTAGAEKILHASNAKDIRSKIDSVAASLILEQYLEMRKMRRQT